VVLTIHINKYPDDRVRRKKYGTYKLKIFFAGFRQLRKACYAGHPKNKRKKYSEGDCDRTDKSEAIVKGFKH